MDDLKILCVFVDGGKGHYIPAKAVAEQLEALGHKVELVDFFHFLNIKLAGRINKYVWRKLLEHSSYEKKFSKKNDQNTDIIDRVAHILSHTSMRRFKKQIKAYNPDMIFTTHPYPDYFLSYLAAKAKVNVPVTYYATDVFAVPMSAVSNKLYRMYVSTEEGCQSAIANGQDPSSVRLCPFPLQASCANSPKMDKAEARRLLGLKEDVFTIQINFGGEGVGATDLLKELGKIEKPIQVLVIGGIEEKTRKELENIISAFPENVDVRLAGFVSNVNDYLNACDIIAGRSGINTLLEAFYLRRPFLITELVYTVLPSADYVEKHQLGWNADHDIPKQVSIVRECMDKPEILEGMDRNFDALPIEFSARALAEMLIEDIESYQTNTKK